jgi:hypothetical protein
MKTYFRLHKDDFSVIYRSLKRSINAGEFENIDLEYAEHLREDIRQKIFGCGTTRQNWQVVDYNDPSFKNNYGRKEYSNYGEYE